MAKAKNRAARAITIDLSARTVTGHHESGQQVCVAFKDAPALPSTSDTFRLVVWLAAIQNHQKGTGRWQGLTYSGDVEPLVKSSGWSLTRSTFQTYWLEFCGHEGRHRGRVIGYRLGGEAVDDGDTYGIAKNLFCYEGDYYWLGVRTPTGDGGYKYATIRFEHVTGAWTDLLAASGKHGDAPAELPADAKRITPWDDPPILQPSGAVSLTPDAPVDTEDNLTLWRKRAASFEQVATGDLESGWIARWPSTHPARITLDYDSLNRQYARIDTRLPDKLLEVFNFWKDSQSPQDVADLTAEPWGTQVKLERVFVPAGHTYGLQIDLSPSKFVYYLGIQQQLWRPAFAEVRTQYFRNAVEGIAARSILELPSVFAIKLAVISADGFALVKQRDSQASLFPDAWEVGVGEMMHGHVQHDDYAHFTASGRPDWNLYLGRAIKEELGYLEEDLDRVRFYGFAVEYRTLAPKLVGVYESPMTLHELETRRDLARDRATKYLGVPLAAGSISDLFSNTIRYPCWTPTSKLALVLALRSTVNSDGDADELVMEVIDRNARNRKT